MLNIKVLLRFFDSGFIQNNLLTLLFLALIPFAEVLFIFYAGDIMGIYLVLACAAATGCLGCFFSYFYIRRMNKKIRGMIKRDQYPAKEFIALAGSIVGSICLIFPGYITDFFGILFFIPLFRNWCGKRVVKKFEIPTKELYEYLKLYEA